MPTKSQGYTVLNIKELFNCEHERKPFHKHRTFEFCKIEKIVKATS